MPGFLDVIVISNVLGFEFGRAEAAQDLLHLRFVAFFGFFTLLSLVNLGVPNGGLVQIRSKLLGLNALVVSELSV